MRVLVVAIILIFLLDAVPLYRKGMKKELITVLLLLLIAMVFEVSKVLDIANPLKIIENLIEPIGRMIFYQY